MLYVHTYNLQGTLIHSSIGTYSELNPATLSQDMQRRLLRRNLGIEVIDTHGPLVHCNNEWCGAFEWGPLLGVYAVTETSHIPELTEFDITTILNQIYDLKAVATKELN